MKLINWECLEEMKKMESESIDLIVTSPPYDNLRTYNWTLNWNFDIFKDIAKECARVIKKGWVIVWVVWDATIKWSKSLTSFKQAIYFKEECWLNVYDNILYQKAGGLLPHKWRYRNCYENMFIFSKWKPKTLNIIKDRPNKYNWTKTGNRTVREVNWKLTEKGVKQIPDFWVRYNIWEYSNGKNQWTTDNVKWHPATFPEKLAEDHIRSWSNEWDIILDPFMWSWTTWKMTRLNNRKFIGIELDENYFKIAQDRINAN